MGWVGGGWPSCIGVSGMVFTMPSDLIQTTEALYIIMSLFYLFIFIYTCCIILYVVCHTLPITLLRVEFRIVLFFLCGLERE